MDGFAIDERRQTALVEELEYVNDGLKELVEDNEDDLVKVPEEVFKEYFLPYMLGLIDKDENNNKVFFNNWMNVAGDIVLGFFVVDKNGEILFKVPKYLADYDDVNTPISDISYITILKTFEKEYERAPGTAENELKQSMDAISSMVGISPESAKTFFEFYKILRERYNDFYIDYKTRMYTTQLEGINSNLVDLENDLLNIDPEDRKNIASIKKQITEMEKEKEKVTLALAKVLNKDVEDIKDSTEELVETAYVEEDYSDVDYED